MTAPVAVIDCGTNSTRLLIASGDGAIRRELRITGLGKGLGDQGRLQPEAIQRVVDAVVSYRELIDDAGATRVRIIATSAARDARNRTEFFDAVGNAAGVEPELLSGHDEARYSFAGATSGLSAPSGPYLVVDIGGGSTEFAVGTTRPEFFESLPIGSVRFTERFLRHDPPAPAELSQAISVVRAHLDDLDRASPLVRAAPTMVGVAGTVTTVAAVELGLEPYDRDIVDGFVLTRSAAEDVFRTLATEALADRVFNPGLMRERAEVIVGGCCVLVAIMRHFDIDECVVRDADLLDAIAAELLES